MQALLAHNGVVCMLAALHRWEGLLQVVPQQWHDHFQQWEEWVYRHRHLQWKQERARRCHCSFLARYFFYFWRFFRARNDRLRAAWAFAAQDRDLLRKWSTLIAFRMYRNTMRRERATQRAVLRHWRAQTRNHAAHCRIALSQLLVRAPYLPACPALLDCVVMTMPPPRSRVRADGVRQNWHSAFEQMLCSATPFRPRQHNCAL